MSEHDPATADDFFEAFFGHGNDFTLAAIDDTSNAPSAGQRYLRARRDDLRTGSLVPVIVPRVQGGTTTWFALAHGARQFRRLGDDLQASLGPTYSTFTRTRAELDSADPSEAAVRTLAGTDPYVYRFVTPTQDVGDVLSALETLYALWRISPKRHFPIQRPTGRILRDFRLAVMQGDRPSAEALLAELQGTDDVSAPNIEFLRIQMLDGVGTGAEILDSPSLATVLNLHQPWPVTAAILRAVRERHFSTVGSLEDAQQIYAQEVRAKYSDLASAPRTPTEASTALLQYLEALAQEPPNRAAIERVVTAAWDRDVLDFELPSLTATPAVRQDHAPEPDDLESAVTEGRWEDALGLAQDANPNPKSVAVALRAAYELHNRECGGQALALLDALTAGQRAKLEESRLVQAQIRALRELAIEVPTDWPAWFAELSGDLTPEVIAKLRAVVDDEGLEPISESQLPTVLAELQRTRDPASLQILTFALPAIVQELQQFPPDTTGIAEARLAVLDLLVIEASFTPQILDAILETLDLAVSGGLDSKSYREAVANVADVWQTIQSIARVDWLLDATLALAFNPKPAPEAFTRLVSEALNWLLLHQAELTADQDARTQTLNMRCPEVELDWPTVTQQVRATGTVDLSDLHVGIYTLAEGSARAAKNALERDHPGIRVTLNHDHRATAALANMTKNCDVVIATWSSAKHGATDFLIRAKSRNTELRWAAGSGSSSILRSIRSNC